MEKLIKRLSGENVKFEILHHNIPISTKQDASHYFKIEETAPALILKTEKGYHVLILSGERDQVDIKQLKNSLTCQNVVVVDRDEVIKNFKIKPNQIPLVGLDLPYIIDNKLFEHEFIYGGSGDTFHTLKITPYDLLKLNNVVSRYN